MQVWHPIGFVMEEHYVNMTLSGLQSTTETFYWNPSAAHSAIDDHGDLYGGIILRGIIDGGLADDNEENNELDRDCLLYTSPSPRDRSLSRMPSSA